MINSMIQWSAEFCRDTVYFNSLFGFLLYWVPVGICAAGFTIRTLSNCAKEVKIREEYEKHKRDYYEPEETIGRIIGRVIVTFIPIANLGMAVFDFGWGFINGLIKFLSQVFNQPLVPYRKRSVQPQPPPRSQYH